MIMAVTKIPRPSTGSGNIKFIDGIGFPGLGSGGFSESDLLNRTLLVGTYKSLYLCSALVL